ncbi:hypothetical protein Tco_0898516 [Tanacetum coccineum]
MVLHGALLSIKEAKRVIFIQKCTLTREELTDFLNDYPIPDKFKIMIPNKNQSIFDAPEGLNPFGLAELTTYIVMCKAYGFEPTLNAFRGVFNLGPAGDWITFFKRDNVIHAEYPALVDEANMGDRKSLKDPLLYIVRRDPLYQRLAHQLIDVQTFPKQILYMAGIAERWAGSPSKPIIMRNGQRMTRTLASQSKARTKIALALAPLQSSSITTMLMQLLLNQGPWPLHHLHNLWRILLTLLTQMLKRKGQGLSKARPSSKRRMQLSTLPSRTTRQKVTMLPIKHSKGKVAASEPLEVFDDEKDMHGLPSTKELPNAMACHIMVRDLIRVYKETKKELGLVTAREAKLKAKYDGVVVSLDANPIVIGLQEEVKSLEGQLKEHGENYGRLLLEERKWAG